MASTINYSYGTPTNSGYIACPSNENVVTTYDPMGEIKARLEKLEKIRKVDYTILACKNCGASIEQKIDDYIFKCRYCGTAYIIGSYQINSQ